MGRAASKTEQVEVTTSTLPQPETISEEKTTASVETEQSSEESVASEKPCRVVVCAYAGTEDLVRKVWEKMSDEPVRIVVVDDGEVDMRNITTVMIADSAVAETFVVVKPNTIPCSRISLAELNVPVVYIDKAGKKHYSHRLPMPFDKNILVDVFASSDYPANDVDDEAFLRLYAEHAQYRPMQVSHYFGNYVTVVLRGNPCMAIIAEGIARRKFLCANAVGFKAAEPFVEALLSK
ncbi:MAG: hypothetical protein IKC96_03275 [Paludibacteraceae bacterium]|nr:hypothetical protein [Paludibacteraceae bacterium]